MKKFIQKRAAELIPGDVVVMANEVEIRVQTCSVTSIAVTVKDTNNNTREWSPSYICYTLNPKHPEFGTP
jgi:hypothetical protein